MFTVHTSGCSKIQTIEELAKYQEIYPEFNSICSNQALVSDLIVRLLCPSVPLAQNWKPGVKARVLNKNNTRVLWIYFYKQIWCSIFNTISRLIQVTESCGILKTYIPVATFNALSKYPSDGQAGVFLGCTNSTIKVCNKP